MKPLRPHTSASIAVMQLEIYCWTIKTTGSVWSVEAELRMEAELRLDSVSTFAAISRLAHTAQEFRFYEQTG